MRMAAKLELLETVRGLAAVKLGLIDDYKKSAWETPGIPKMTFVAEPDAYETADGTTIRKEEIDLLSRMMSMQKSHPSYAMTGAMCTAAAAVVPGSVVAQVLNRTRIPSLSVSDIRAEYWNVAWITGQRK